MFDDIIGKIKDMGGMGMLKVLPKSKIAEVSKLIEYYIASRLTSFPLCEGETPAALILEGNGNYMINIVVMSEDLSVTKIIERFSVNELLNNIVEDLKNGHQ